MTDLWWLGTYQFLREVVGLQSTADPGPAYRLACSAGWWWPYEGAVVLTERPAELHLDELGRAHSTSGPAIRYRDGWGVHALHGVRIRAEQLQPSAEDIARQ